MLTAHHRQKLAAFLLGERTLTAADAVTLAGRVDPLVRQRAEVPTGMAPDQELMVAVPGQPTTEQARDLVARLYSHVDGGSCLSCTTDATDQLAAVWPGVPWARLLEEVASS